MLQRKLLFASLLFFFCLNAGAQTPEKALDYVRENYSPEGIYIHYDKDSYIAGETIWFKAYLFAGRAPSIYSTVLDIELLTDSGRVLSKKILPIIGGAAVGNFELKKDAAQMSYTVRAYTRRMLNFGIDHFYQHNIKVYNPSTASTAVIENTAETYLYFFPEGGNLVGGVPNMVAFKGTDKYGFPLESTGEITDSKGNAVATFKSVHDGMGSVAFFPQDDETYKATYTIGDKKASTSLPPVKVSGITFQVQTTTENQKFFVINKEKLANEDMDPAYLLGVMDNNVLINQDLPAGPLIRGELPVKNMPSGILQLTLFNKKDQPISERMLFINNQDFLLKGQLNLDTVSITPKAKNVYSFTLEDTQAVTLSVSVTDYDKTISADSRENIISRLMLSNDIKGYLHNPIYYFEKGNDENAGFLDLVMMTNGWRRYNWDQILNKRLPALTYKDGNYISFEGRTYKNNSTTLLPAVKLFGLITTKDSASDFIPVTADNEGRFRIDGMIFDDSASFDFQQADPKVKDKSVSISTYSLPLSKQFAYLSPIHAGNAYRFRPDAVYSVIINEQFKNITLNDNGVITLKDIKLRAVKARSKTALVQDKYAKGLFSGSATHTTDLVTNPERIHYRNVFDYMKNNYPGVDIYGNSPDYTVSIRQTRNFTKGLLPAALFLDGIETSSYFISTIPFDQIALIKVYSNGFVGAVGNGPTGVVAVFTKEGEDRPYDAGLGLNKVKVEGFSPVKEFFSPDYSTPNNNIAADTRTTLYWNPYLLGNKENRTISFSFFNTPETKKFRVVLTGMDAQGKLLYIEKIVE